MNRDTITLPRSVVEQALEALNATMATHGKREWIEAAKQQADATLRSALEQPQVKQEPVAWQGRDGYLYHFIEEPKPGDRPLYTHPQPPRQPLTDEEIRDVAFDVDAAYGSVIEFARAIERAHGITGE